jgi:hypothetical protein
MKIFDIQNDKVVLTPNCLLIPAFKTVVEEFPDSFATVLAYVDFMTNPESPYADVPEADKEFTVYQALNCDFSLEDEVVIEALKIAEGLYITPTRRFYLDAKIGLEKMGKYLRESSISSGRDGNDSTYLSMLKSLGKITLEFGQLEKVYKEEVATLRGSQEASYDE